MCFFFLIFVDYESLVTRSECEKHVSSPPMPSWRSNTGSASISTASCATCTPRFMRRKTAKTRDNRRRNGRRKRSIQRHRLPNRLPAIRGWSVSTSSRWPTLPMRWFWNGCSTICSPPVWWWWRPAIGRRMICTRTVCSGRIFCRLSRIWRSIALSRRWTAALIIASWRPVAGLAEGRRILCEYLDIKHEEFSNNHTSFDCYVSQHRRCIQRQRSDGHDVQGVVHPGKRHGAAANADPSGPWSDIPTYVWPNVGQHVSGAVRAGEFRKDVLKSYILSIDVWNVSIFS